jgi:hypothetical protein
MLLISCKSVEFNVSSLSDGGIVKEKKIRKIDGSVKTKTRIYKNGELVEIEKKNRKSGGIVKTKNKEYINGVMVQKDKFIERTNLAIRLVYYSKEVSYDSMTGKKKNTFIFRNDKYFRRWKLKREN